MDTTQNIIKIEEANVHNLKNVSLEIPKNKLVIITGVSGSGKSSLAFDTLYAEGQRRYVESLSAYARQFLGLMQKPDVKSITGLSPAISIDQKTSGSNPRSTVGTVTEIYDYLRLLYAQVGVKYCPDSGVEMKEQTIDEIANDIKSSLKEKDKITILSPIIQSKKGEQRELLDTLLSKGFLRARIDGQIVNIEEIEEGSIEKNKKHNIEIVVDRLQNISAESTKEEITEFEKRLKDGIELAASMANGEIITIIEDKESFYSEKAISPVTKISYPKITPASFSFNSPHGACLACDGLGAKKDIMLEAIHNPKLTINEGGIFPWANRTTSDSWISKVLESVAIFHDFNLSTPIGKYPQDIFNLIFYGENAKDSYRITYRNKQGLLRDYDAKFEGVIPELLRRYKETTSAYVRSEVEKYLTEKECSVCNGQRLQRYPLAVKIGKMNINDMVSTPIIELTDLISNIDLKGNKKTIASPILKEINSRLSFLVNVGLGYLTLNRKANTLSGGEAQRIRLASQIGTGLTGVLYVLDEPSIGLHSRDVSKLIHSLEGLRDLGNSVVVVEHDYDTIKSADHIIDVGPGAGTEGGEIIAEGNYENFMKQGSLTAQYLNGTKRVGEGIKKSSSSDQIKKQRYIELNGVSTHNLKNVDLKIPLSKMVCVTGVSGSGKSSLINDTLYPLLMNEKMKAKRVVGPYESVDGLEYIDKVIGISQSPIGKTPRSNPATYIGAFDLIRELFANTQESRARGYKSGRFSFNVKGGRCEKCKGDGQIKVEMQFLPDIYVTCEECNGKRYNKEALQIDYKGKNISEVLDMRVSEAVKFFKNINPIFRKIKLLDEVGLSYIKLGQYATTLSGGESQRIKLAKELSKVAAGNTVYILDEPTTGLHFHDIDKLLKVLTKLTDKGHSVIIIEHNMDIIRFADWIIDIGPEGGSAGGKIIAEGTVEDIVRAKDSHTGKFLKEYLESMK